MKLYFSRFKNEYNQEPPKNCCCCLVTKPCLTLCDLRNWAHQTPLSMGFIRQEYWSGLPFPPLGDLPDPGIKPESPVSCIDRCVLYHWATKETHLKIQFSSVQFSSATQSWWTLCDPMKHSTSGLPVHHQLLESTQIHVHWIGDAIQTSHPVVPFSSCPQSFPGSGSFQMSQLFESGGQSIGVSASISVLPMDTQTDLL